MRGPDGVRDQLATLLGDVIPTKITALRAAYGVGPDVLPDLALVSSGEIPDSTLSSLGPSWVEVINPRLTPGLKRVDIDPAGYPVYRLRYACRLYVWVLAVDWPTAVVQRDMLVGTVRQTLLEYPTLSTTPGDSGYLLHEDTYTEEFGQPLRAPNDSGRTWASALQSIDLWTEESMADGALRPPIGENRSTIIGATVLGPGVPIPDDLPRPPGFPPVVTDPEEDDSGSP